MLDTFQATVNAVLEIIWSFLPGMVLSTQAAGTILYVALADFPSEWNGSYFTVGRQRINSSEATMAPLLGKRLYDEIDSLIRSKQPLFFRQSQIA
jgi:hypothetical protein